MKKIITFLIVATMFLSLPLQITASTIDIDDVQNELEDIKDQIDDTSNRLDGVKRNQRNVTQELAIVERDLQAKERELHTIEQELAESQAILKQTTAELDTAEKELEQANNELDAVKQELEKAIQDAEDQEELMADRLRAMYMNRNTSYLELLFESKSLNDFFTKVDMIKQMALYDNQVFDELKACRDDIELKKAECEEKAASIEGKRNEIRSKKVLLEEKTREISSTKARVISQRSNIERSQNEKNRLLGQLGSDEATLKRELAKLDQQTKELEKRIQELTRQSQGEYSGGIMAWPVPHTTRVSSDYGMRYHPIYRVNRMHTGIDIASPGINGKPAVAAADGVVTHSGYLGGYGYTIMIDHGSGITTLYAHGRSLLVSAGQRVTKGTPVLAIGSSGDSTGPHLHFEVRKNGYHTSPWPYLRGN